MLLMSSVSRSTTMISNGLNNSSKMLPKKLVNLMFSQLFKKLKEAFTISFDIDVETHRQRKALERNPVLFLTKKMNNAEVQFDQADS